MINYIKFNEFGITGNSKIHDYKIDFKNNKKCIIIGNNGVGKTSLMNTLIGIFQNDTSWYSYVSFKSIEIEMQNGEKINIDGKIDIQKISDISDTTFSQQKNHIILAIKTLQKYSYLFIKSEKEELDNIDIEKVELSKIWDLINKMITSEKNQIGPDSLVNELSTIINIRNATPNEFVKRIKDILLQNVNYINNMNRNINTKQTEEINKIRANMDQKYEYYSIFRFANNYFESNQFNNAIVNKKYEKIINYEMKKNNISLLLNNFNDKVKNRIQKIKQNIFKKIISDSKEQTPEKSELLKIIQVISDLLNNEDEEIKIILKSLNNNDFYNKMHFYFSDFLSEKTKNTIKFFNNIQEFNRKVSDLLSNKKVIFEKGNFWIENSEGIKLKFNEYPFSSGENQMIEMLYSLILTDKEIIMIDEPEISLSIRWQRILRDAINIYSKNSNIIYVTHSPFLITKNDISNKAILKMGDNE